MGDPFHTMNAREARLSVQLKQRFCSEIFWHFPGRGKSAPKAYSILLEILKTGLRVGEKTEFICYDRSDKEPVVMHGCPITCVADIPLKDLSIHEDRYGRFAIGFHKESVINNDFNPVLYVNHDSFVNKLFKQLRDELNDFADGDKLKCKKMRRLLELLGTVAKAGNIKAVPKADPKLDKAHLNNFYYEREWRTIHDWNFKKEDVALVIVPDHLVLRLKKEVKGKRVRLNEHTPILPFSMIHRL